MPAKTVDLYYTETPSFTNLKSDEGEKLFTLNTEILQCCPERLKNMKSPISGIFNLVTGHDSEQAHLIVCYEGAGLNDNHSSLPTLFFLSVGRNKYTMG